MIVTLRQMQYVISVAKHGSFSKAADECAADQSTVSQQIKTFEDRMNTNIFDRSLPSLLIAEYKINPVIQIITHIRTFQGLSHFR